MIPYSLFPDWLLSLAGGGSLPSFILFVLVNKCWGQHPFMSSTFSLAFLPILDGTCSLCCYVLWLYTMDAPVCGMDPDIKLMLCIMDTRLKNWVSGHLMYTLCSSSSSRSRTDRWDHFQQNAGLRLFVRTWIVHGIDDCYQLTRTSGGFSAQCLSKLFLKEFTVLLLTTSLGRAFQVVVF